MKYTPSWSYKDINLSQLLYVCLFIGFTFFYVRLGLFSVKFTEFQADITIHFSQSQRALLGARETTSQLRILGAVL